MKILFSPSETKFKGGETKKINKNSFLFPELFEERLKVINQYQQYIDIATNKELEKLFGTKKEDIIDYYKGNILEKECKNRSKPDNDARVRPDAKTEFNRTVKRCSTGH